MTEEEKAAALVITLKDVYDELRATKSEVRDLKENVALLTPQAERLADHETRMRSLEKWKYGLPTSMVMAAAALIAAVTQGTGKG